MKNLFLIDGASGTGKTDLINYLSDYNSLVSFVSKYTTRDYREYEKVNDEKLDLINLSSKAFEYKKFEYQYTYGGFKYGFSKEQIFEKFKKSDDVFVIVRNINLIKRLKNDFGFLNVISIFIYTDRDQIIKRLKKDNHKPEEIRFRIERLEIAYNSYLKNPTFYDEVIINSGSKLHYQKIIDDIFNKYKSITQIDPNFIFVLMSFNPDYNEIYDELVDAAKLVNNSLIVKRIDKQRGDYKITDEILNNISKARLIICDLTDERPNVYYELGFSRGIKKKVIACARRGTKLHFDIKDFRTILYNSTSELRKEIFLELRERLENNR